MVLPLETELPPEATRKQQSRLTVISKVYYSPADEDSKDYSRGNDRNLETQDLQEYDRRVTLTSSFQEISTGWLGDDANLVLIQNKAISVLKYTSNPNQNDLDTESGNVVEYKFKDSEYCFFVRPGFDQPFEASSIKNLRIRCREGSVKIRLVVFPR